GDVKPLLQQSRREVLRSDPMSVNREALFFGLVPRIHAALVVQPGLDLCCIVSENGKRGNTVFPVIFKLIVAPDDTEVGLKLIEGAARQAKTIDHRPTMLVGMGLTFIGSPLPAHSFRPVVERTQALR